MYCRRNSSIAIELCIATFGAAEYRQCVSVSGRELRRLAGRRVYRRIEKIGWMRASTVLTSGHRARHNCQLLTDPTGAAISSLNTDSPAPRRAASPLLVWEVARALTDACRRPAVYTTTEGARLEPSSPSSFVGVLPPLSVFFVTLSVILCRQVAAGCSCRPLLLLLLSLAFWNNRRARPTIVLQDGVRRLADVSSAVIT